jgi:hypothetical protein
VGGEPFFGLTERQLFERIGIAVELGGADDLIAAVGFQIEASENVLQLHSAREAQDRAGNQNSCHINSREHDQQRLRNIRKKREHQQYRQQRNRRPECRAKRLLDEPQPADFPLGILQEMPNADSRQLGHIGGHGRSFV